MQAKGENLIKQSDRTFLLNILNYEVTDLFSSLGIDTTGGKFIFEETEDSDIEKQLRIVQGLHSMGLAIPDNYLYEKFGIDKPEQDEPKKEAKTEEGSNVKPVEGPKQKARNLFGSLFGGWRRFFV